MLRIKKIRWLQGIFIIGGILFLTFLTLLFRPEWEHMDKNNYTPGRVPIMVIGDSDSHSYRDSYYGTHRGGKYHNVTFQWTEILARIRPSEVDLGQFGFWGSHNTIYRIRKFLGLYARPRKQDFEYNFAVSGATCDTLAPQSFLRQSYLASSSINKHPGYWNNGLVIIRIGVNDFGQWRHLKNYVAGNITPQIKKPILNCIGRIHDTVSVIRATNKSVKIILLGIMDNSNWPPAMPLDDAGHHNINKVLDIYDDGLRSIARKDTNILFVEDRKWVEQIIGYWNSNKHIGYREINLGGKTNISNTAGDNPHNIILNDEHSSTVLNSLWIRHLFHKINDYFGIGFTPLLDSEIADLADPAGQFGIAPAKSKNTNGPSISMALDHIELPIEGIGDYRLSFEATDADGNDISATATAYIESGDAQKLYLFGDGRNLRFDSSRHVPGKYILTLQVQDRYQRKASIQIPLTIRSSTASGK